MKISSAFPSKYLKAADLPMGREVTVTIDSMQMEQLDDNQDRPVCYFRGKSKGLVLNSTNASTISVVYGDETDAWVGRPLVIFNTTTMYKGQRVACLRVRIPAEAAAALTEEPESQTPPNDDIPF